MYMANTRGQIHMAYAHEHVQKKFEYENNCLRHNKQQIRTIRSLLHSFGFSFEALTF